MTQHKSLKLILVVAVLALAALACEGSFSTANFKDAYMAADPDGEVRTSTYAPDDIFYAVVDLANAPDDTVTKAVWYTVDVEMDESDNITIGEYSFTSGDSLVIFHLQNEDGYIWPNGSYKVELYLNDELETTLDFSVQE